MITKEEIQKIDGINRDAVEFFLKLAEDCLHDALKTKEELEKKAYIMFAGYIAAISALVVLTQRVNSPIIGLAIALLIFGIFCLFLSIRTQEYGVRGIQPSKFLESDIYIKKEEWNDVGLLKAYVLWDYEIHIVASKKSNELKANCIDFAVWSGLLSIVVLLSFVLFV